MTDTSNFIKMLIDFQTPILKNTLLEDESSFSILGIFMRFSGLSTFAEH